MTILVDDFPGADADTVRRVLVRARSIAPSLDSLEGEPREDALAILRGVVREVPEAGARRARSMSRNGTSISFDSAASLFTSEDIAGLRALCGMTTTGGPLGSFPADRPLKGLWPEETYL